VFWQVGSAATLDTTTVFAGNIIALTSITLNTGANVTGSVLARNGAVTMDSNNVARCTGTPTALDESEQPQLPPRLYLPWLGHQSTS
jgi:hypothetical protein